MPDHGGQGGRSGEGGAEQIAVFGHVAGSHLEHVHPRHVGGCGPAVLRLRTVLDHRHEDVGDLRVGAEVALDPVAQPVAVVVGIERGILWRAQPEPVDRRLAGGVLHGRDGLLGRGRRVALRRHGEGDRVAHRRDRQFEHEEQRPPLDEMRDLPGGALAAVGIPGDGHALALLEADLEIGAAPGRRLVGADARTLVPIRVEIQCEDALFEQRRVAEVHLPEEEAALHVGQVDVVDVEARLVGDAPGEHLVLAPVHEDKNRLGRTRLRPRGQRPCVRLAPRGQGHHRQPRQQLSEPASCSHCRMLPGVRSRPPHRDPVSRPRPNLVSTQRIARGWGRVKETKAPALQSTFLPAPRSITCQRAWSPRAQQTVPRLHQRAWLGAVPKKGRGESGRLRWYHSATNLALLIAGWPDSREEDAAPGGLAPMAPKGPTQHSPGQRPGNRRGVPRAPEGVFNGHGGASAGPSAGRDPLRRPSRAWRARARFPGRCPGLG